MRRKKADRKNDPLSKFRQFSRREDPTVLRQENDAAALVGGRRHAGSGSSAWKKSDASSEQYQVECKQTEKASISLKLEWLEKLLAEAMPLGKWPLLHIRFLIGSEKDWVLMPESVFRKIVQSSAQEDPSEDLAG